MADPQPRPKPPGIVEPFYLGDPPLFAALHPGSGERGAVICPPIGHEAIVFHRAARQLATQISRRGLPVLRFDYSGTGDSAGDLDGVRLDTWVADVGRALDALRERTEASRLTLIGIRLGASLALLASQDRDDVDELALWDPVISGRTYLKQLRRDHRRMLRVAHALPAPPGDPVPKSDDLEALGFLFPKALVEDLRALELDATTPPERERYLLLETTRGESAPLGAVLRGSGSEVETRTETLPNAWRWSEDITRVQLPHAQVRAVAGWTTGGGR